MKIGALINGQDYYDGDCYELPSYNGHKLAEIIHFDNNALSWILKRKFTGTNLYRSMTVEEVLCKFRKAGDLFRCGKIKMGDKLIDENEYAELVSLSTGVPRSVPLDTLEQLSNLMANIEEVLKIQIPNGDLRALEQGYYTVGEKAIGWIPKADNLFVMTPSNHPNVNNLWILAAAMGYRIIIRPSDDDPFTPYRLIQCFIEAGLPENNFSFIPADHSAIDNFVDFAGLSMLFGGSNLKEKYGGNKKVKVFGPGCSSIIVDEKFYKRNRERTIETILSSMTKASGRGCVNASYVFFIGKGIELAESLAKAVSDFEIAEPLETESKIGAIKSSKSAEYYNNAIESMIGHGFSELTEKYRKTPRMVKFNGAAFLLPTILYQTEAGIAGQDKIGMELPFPFVTFIDGCDNHNFISHINSLSVSFLSDDNELFQKLLFSQKCRKLFYGIPTNYMDFSNPHEGYLSRFLYEEKALSIKQS